MAQPTSPALDAAMEKRVIRKAFVRLLPFLGLMYFLNSLDRSNIGFAAPHGLATDLALTSGAFGLAAGLFYVGYVIFEIPSNLVLNKFGARRWLARIMVSWGIVASVTAFVQTSGQFYALRILLGIAEAGFTPGVLLFLTFWFPKAVRGKAIALFGLAIPIASALGSVVSAYIIQYGDRVLFDLPGWRLMILIEGIPSIIVGIWCWFYLTDKPSDAKWLTTEERTWLTTTMEAEDQETRETHRHSVMSALMSGRTLALVGIYVCMQYGNQAVGFFLPTIVAGFSQQFNTEFSIIQQGAIVAIPFVLGGIAMIVNGWHSDKVAERGLHFGIPLIVGGCAIPLALYQSSPFMVMLFVCICLMGFLASLPILWTLPPVYMEGAAAAAGIALINSAGNIGGFGGPYVTGWVTDWTGNPKASMWVAGIVMVVGGLGALALRRSTEKLALPSTPLAAPVPAAE
jgi:MFS family permease